MNTEQRKVIKQAIKRYGFDMQITVCIEEMSELIKELCKVKRRQTNPAAIAEEMADVKIMLEQMQIIFDNSAEVERFYDAKIKRLKNRLISGI